MNQKTTALPGLEVTLTAHRDDRGHALLATVTAGENSDPSPRMPMRVALVIDRSGSMSGDKLAITRQAVAEFIRSLDPQDQVAVVTFDDKVNLLSGLAAPSEALAHKVDRIDSGGSTDLYGGWVTGAKIVGLGGRVVLLSDGQANVGRYTDAGSLARHAAISYEKFGVTTTTIGVGEDYDEALMAGMARMGHGAHYFAHTARAISDAFSQERYSAGSIAIERLSLRVNGATEQLGHFWESETKRRVFLLGEATLQGASVRYTDRATGARESYELALPTEFSYSEEVRLEILLQQAADLEDRMVEVHSSEKAAEMRHQLRNLVLDILAHPASDEPHVRAVIDRLRASIDRLERLERNYIEDEAVMHRKRSLQTSYNMRERAKAFSSFADEACLVFESATTARAPMASVQVELDPDAFALVPVEVWMKWEALPIDAKGPRLVVAMEDPRRGFVVKDIERATGRRVHAVFAGLSTQEIVDRLRRG